MLTLTRCLTDTSMTQILHARDRGLGENVEAPQTNETIEKALLGDCHNLAIWRKDRGTNVSYSSHLPILF